MAVFGHHAKELNYSVELDHHDDHGTSKYMDINI